MALFTGTVVNKRDQKGRVSVPAHFRAELAGQSFHGFVAFPSFRHKALECCSKDFMRQVSLALDEDTDAFSPEQEEAANLIIAEACDIPFDGEGRVVIPQPLLEFAGLTDQIAFVGQGSRFQIWNPEARGAITAQVRERARDLKLSLRLKPLFRSAGGSGGAS